MAQPGQGTPDIAAVRLYLSGVAKYLLDKMHGPTGPPWGTPLANLEDLLLALQQQLAADFFALALQRQAQQHSHAPPEFLRCPSCQNLLDWTADPQPHYTRTPV